MGIIIMPLIPCLIVVAVAGSYIVLCLLCKSCIVDNDKNENLPVPADHTVPMLLLLLLLLAPFATWAWRPVQPADDSPQHYSVDTIEQHLNSTGEWLADDDCTAAIQHLLQYSNESSADLLARAYIAGSYTQYTRMQHSRYIHSMMYCVKTARKEERRLDFCYTHNGGQHTTASDDQAVGVCVPSECTGQQSRRLAGHLLQHQSNSNASSSLRPPVCVATEYDRPWYLRPAAMGELAAEVVIIGLGVLAIYSSRLWPHSQQRWPVLLLNAFDLRRNAQRLLAVPSAPSATVHCLGGIRVLSMVWCVLGHSYHLAQPFVDRVHDYQQELAFSWFGLLMTNFTLCVDTFFVLSGALTAYSFFTRINAGHSDYVDVSWRSWRFWLRFYRHRLVRLWPAYIFMMAATTLRLNGMPSHPVWPLADPTVQCAATWWHNLLFLNSLLPYSSCMLWTWYLANDLLYFVCSPLLLLGLRRTRAGGTALIVLLCLVGCVIRGVLVAVNNWPPLPMFAYTPESFNPDVAAHFFLMYVRPYTRFGPYLVGLQLGHVLAHCQPDSASPTKRPSVPRLLVTATGIAILGLVSLLGILPALHDQRGGGWELYNIVYASCARLQWSVFVGCVIYMCHSGRAQYLNRLLSARAWVPLANTAYGTYLFHITPIAGSYLILSRFPYVWKGHLWHLLRYASPQLLLGWVGGLVAAMLVEVPVLNIEKLLLKGRPMSSPAKTNVQQMTPMIQQA